MSRGTSPRYERGRGLSFPAGLFLHVGCDACRPKFPLRQPSLPLPLLSLTWLALLLALAVLQDNILDLYMAKWWAIKLATDAVSTVLKVDQIIMSKQAGGPKPRDGGPGDD